jgi:hypothetical protein
MFVTWEREQKKKRKKRRRRRRRETRYMKQLNIQQHKFKKKKDRF